MDAMQQGYIFNWICKAFIYYKVSFGTVMTQVPQKTSQKRPGIKIFFLKLLPVLRQLVDFVDKVFFESFASLIYNFGMINTSLKFWEKSYPNVFNNYLDLFHSNLSTVSQMVFYNEALV